MALPPPSILLVCVLMVVDIVGAAALAAFISIFGFSETGIGALFGGEYAFFFLGSLALKVIALFGLFWARRWAVIAGAVSFQLPLPTEWMMSMPFTLFVMAGSIVLFLACTLPHWERMTWRLP